MMPRRWIPIVPLLVAFATVSGLRAQTPQAGAATTSTDRILTVDHLRDRVKYFASDALAGRRTGTPENLEAAQYIAGEFRRIGLQPFDSTNGYFQYFDYLTGYRTGENNSMRVSSAAGERSLALGTDFTPLSFSGTNSASGPVVFAGYGISAEHLGYDDYDGLDAKNHVVVVMRGSPDGDNPHSEFAHYAALVWKVRNATSHGALALVLIDRPDDADAGPPESFIRNMGDVGMPVIFASAEALGTLTDPSGRSLGAVEQLIDSARAPHSFAVKDLTVAIQTQMEPVHVRVPNVVGVLPGHDPALRDQIIFVGGHFDHLGLGGEGSLYTGPPAIHHGADDNASGTTGMLTLAEMMASRGDNRHTFVFAGFNGEEEGLLGSANLVDSAPLDSADVIAMLNMDMIGRLDTNELIVGGTGTSPAWDTLLKSAAGDLRLKFNREGFGPSDHSSFYMKNIPVLFLFTGLHSDYHKPSDTWDKVDYPGMRRVVAFADRVVDRIDAMDAPPEFSETPQENRQSMAFHVYVGTIPDYGYDGKGLRLSGVSPGGPAEKAGLKGGDVILSMDGTAINNIYDYTAALGKFEPGQKVETVLQRGDERLTVTITMDAR